MRRECDKFRFDAFLLKRNAHRKQKSNQRLFGPLKMKRKLIVRLAIFNMWILCLFFIICSGHEAISMYYFIIVFYYYDRHHHLAECTHTNENKCPNDATAIGPENIQNEKLHIIVIKSAFTDVFYCTFFFLWHNVTVERLWKVHQEAVSCLLTICCHR